MYPRGDKCLRNDFDRLNCQYFSAINDICFGVCWLDETWWRGIAYRTDEKMVIGLSVGTHMKNESGRVGGLQWEPVGISYYWTPELEIDEMRKGKEEDERKKDREYERKDKGNEDRKENKERRRKKEIKVNTNSMR